MAVPSSGGSSYHLLYSEEIEDSYSSTTAATLREIDLSEDLPAGGDALLLFQARRTTKSGGYFYGGIAICQLVPGWDAVDAGNSSFIGEFFSYTNANKWHFTTTKYGIYADTVTKEGVLTIKHKYNSTIAATINGTYTIGVYLLDYAPGGNPFS